MNLAECSELLTIASVIDSRTVARETVTVWHQAIGHIDLDVAMAALNLHRQESTEYLQPAHIIRLAYRVKEKRAVDRGPVECPLHPHYPLPCDSCARDRAEGIT